YLARVLRLATDVAAVTGDGRDETVDKAVAKTVDECTRLVERHRLNVAVARFMELTSTLRKAVDAGGQPGASLRDGMHALATMLSCYAPYAAEEIWSRLGHDVAAGDSVHASSWPTADPALLVEDTVTCVVQVGGKVRDRLEVPPGIDEAALRELALASDAVQRALDGGGIRTVIVRPPRLVNVVPA
ncbi:MAG: leucyl-tRNA synthetase, partial [Frankiaceae bacterium]|nr:leucyl-tRNA synthetase [Frankiaceae bacterium]